jgi:uncharacterized protein YjbI with pentapeptide repeats
MANPSHLEILKQGIPAWNLWQKRSFTINPDLSKIELSKIDLKDAILYMADLRYTILTNITLARANLRNADLTGAVLNRVDLQQTSLDDTKLYKADLSLALNLTQEQINAAWGDNLTKLPSTLHFPLRWREYRDAFALGVLAANEWRNGRPDAPTNFLALKFSDADLRGIDLHDCQLAQIDFSNTDLTTANFRNANLAGAIFQNGRLFAADLTNARLDYANLAHVDLAEANLADANLTNAIVDGSNFFQTTLTDTKLHGIDLCAALNLQQRQIDDALGSKSTRLPPKLHYPLHWLDYEEAFALGVSAANEWRRRRAHQQLDLSYISIEGADLRGIDFSYCDLSLSNLTRTSLIMANLRGANLSGAILRGTQLFGADISYADLSTVDELSQSQVDIAIGNSQTRLPPKIVRPSTWPQSATMFAARYASFLDGSDRRIALFRRSDTAASLRDISETEFSDLSSEQEVRTENDAISTAELAKLRASAQTRQSEHIEDHSKEIVDCSVFAPPAAPPGRRIRVQIFMHLDSDLEHVVKQAMTHDARAIHSGQHTLKYPVARGDRIDIQLDSDGLEIIGDLQKWTIWRGRPSAETFIVRLPEDGNGREFLPKVILFVRGAPAGEVVFEISCTVRSDEIVSELRGQSSRPYRRIFFSYSSKDRPKVALVARSYSIIEQEFFQDILNLDPGERWEQKLYKKIDEADLFMLFWSESARASEWVRKEVEYALLKEKDQGRPTFMPFPLEGPPPPDPWPVIKDRHMGDPLYYQMAQQVIRGGDW